MPNMSTYSERLQHVAGLKKIYQPDLVEGIKKDRSTVNRWWNGEIVPGAKNNDLIAHFIGCDPKWLASGKGEPFPEQTGNVINQNVKKNSAVVNAQGLANTTITNKNDTLSDSECEGLCKKLTPLQKNAIQMTLDLGDDEDWKWLIQRVMDKLGGGE